MKRLLIVTPNFLPSTSADMHRVRLAAPFAKAHGWAIEILCVDAVDNDAPTDTGLLAEFPGDIPIHRVRAPRRAWHRWLGMNSLFRRAVVPISRAGNLLLRNGKFDLVYFSSTAFGTFALGPIWRRQFGVPYVLDFQDPWQNDYYRRTGLRPPGGWLKYALSQWQARRLEPNAVRMAAGLTAVSQGYLEQIRGRYVRIPATLELPFPADDTPWPECGSVQRGLWTSVGRGGEDLALAASSLFHALAQRRRVEPAATLPLQFRFIGTSYAAPGTGKPSIAPIAELQGWTQIEERTDRVSFRQARQLQAESEGLVALLSDDPAYQPSKLAGLIASGKPLLVVAPATHRVHCDLAHVEGVILLVAAPAATFSSVQWAQLLSPKPPQWPEAIRNAFQAEANAKQLFGFLDACCADSASEPASA